MRYFVLITNIGLFFLTKDKALVLHLHGLTEAILMRSTKCVFVKNLKKKSGYFLEAMYFL